MLVVDGAAALGHGYVAAIDAAGAVRPMNRLLPLAGVGAAALLLPIMASGALARVMGSAPAKPYAEAVATSRGAAKAVIARAGRESCLIGKLTNALLGLSSSCEAAGERGPLCVLADRAAATTRLSIEDADAIANQLLEL